MNTDTAPPCSLGRRTPDGASGGCTSGQPAAFRVQFTFMRGDLSGVESKDFNVCIHCYHDKMREAEDEGSTFKIIAAYRK